MTAIAEPVDILEYADRISLDLIDPSPTNPRTHFSEAYIDELARSIAEKGLIQSIVVRGRPGDRYEIVAGECRFRASKRAGLTSIAVIVREYTDEQVLEIQLIENTHRTDLTPLEQAVGYRRLIDTNPTKHSAETIATRIGMSPAYVWDRLKLNDLIPEAKALLESEKMAAGHAILIARLKPADQARIINPREDALFEPLKHGLKFDGDSDPKEPKGAYDDVKAVSVRELDAWIARHIRFDVEHAAKAVPLQFEETAQKVHTAAAQPGRGKKVIAITFDHGPADDAKDPNERTYGAPSWRRADGTEKTTRIESYSGGYSSRLVDSPTCEHSVLGVVTVGRQHYGETFAVCIARDRCQVHWKKEIAEREKNAKLRAKGETARGSKNETAAAERQKAEREAEERERKAWRAAVPALHTACVGRVETAKVTALIPILLHNTTRSVKKAIEFLGQPKSSDALVRVLVLAKLISQSDDDYWGPKSFPALGKKIGVDVAAILKQQQTGAAAAAPAAKKKAVKKR